MKSLIEKRGLFLALFVFIAPHALYASESISQPNEQVQKDYRAEPRPNCKLLVSGYCRVYNLPKEVYFMIIRFALPKDLSDQDLSGVDLTGYQFIGINLTDTNLKNAILTNTTCDYQKAFQDHLKQNKCKGGDWYKKNLPKDLKSIAEVYSKLKNHVDKVKLLHIACGLSRLPFYTNTAFYIKLQYWSCALLQLKNKLGNPYGEQIICSLASNLNFGAENYCWSTEYPQNDVNLDEKAPHADFGKYLTNFNNGLINYKCKSEDSDGFNYYKKQIELNIKGLQKTYRNIDNKELQKEACQIGCALSKSYQIQGVGFLFHYLFYQNHLIRFKNLVEIMVKNDIHYNTVKGGQCLLFVGIMIKNGIHYNLKWSPTGNTFGWSHGKK